MSSSPFFRSRASERRWVEHFDAIYTIDMGIHPCVFRVPQGMRSSNPEAYTPRAVGLGPYHHFSPEVQQMESHKREAVKEYLKVVDFQKFIKFVHEMPKKFDPAPSSSSSSSSPNTGEVPKKLDQPSSSSSPSTGEMREKFVPAPPLHPPNMGEMAKVIGHSSSSSSPNKGEKPKTLVPAPLPHPPNMGEMAKVIGHSSYSSSPNKGEKPKTLVPAPPPPPPIMGEMFKRIYHCSASSSQNKGEIPKIFSLASTSSNPHRKKPQKFECTIRSFYDHYLDLDSATLARIIIIDGIFFLNLLSTWPNTNNQTFASDVLMLENQIPLTLLNEIRKALQVSFNVVGDFHLMDKFVSLCEHLSPLALAEGAMTKAKAFDKHILHFMYKMIVENYKDPDVIATQEQTKEESAGVPMARRLFIIGENAKQAAIYVNSLIDQAGSSGLNCPKNMMTFSRFLHQLTKTFDSGKDREKGPLEDKIDVLAASQLNQIAGIQFAKVDGGIRNIWFNDKKNVLYLPVMTLTANSEVILRNLVAYEAAAYATLGLTQELREFVDLMCGIIDRKKDVELLKKGGIIKGDLDDEGIIRIFNGIRKSTQGSDKTSIVRMIVQKMNVKYSNSALTKLYNFTAKAFPILVLLLLALQSYCQMFGCRGQWSGFTAAAPDFSFRNESAISFDPQAIITMPRKALPNTT